MSLRLKGAKIRLEMKSYKDFILFFLLQCIQSNFDNLIIPGTMELGRIMSYLSFARHVYEGNSDSIDLITKGKPDNCWYSIGYPKQQKKDSVFEVYCFMKQTKTCKRRGAIKIKHFSFVNKYIFILGSVSCQPAGRRLFGLLPAGW